MTKQQKKQERVGRPIQFTKLRLRGVSLEEAQWEALEVIRAARGTTASNLLREAVEDYLKKHKKR